MTTLAVDRTILAEVRCPWHRQDVKIGEVQRGAAYKLRCPHCGKYREGVAELV